MNYDEMFIRLHTNEMAMELYRCLKCGGTICERETHRAIHESLELMQATLDYLTRKHEQLNKRIAENAPEETA